MIRAALYLTSLLAICASAAEDAAFQSELRAARLDYRAELGTTDLKNFVTDSG